TFRVTVSSTLSQHEVTHIVRKTDPTTGCHWRTDSDVKDTITLSSAQPVRMSLTDLVRGGADYVRLNARETRGGSYWDGWESGCPALATEPASRSVTSGCGTRRFDVSQSLTAVGYAAPSSSNFRVTYNGILLEPFRGTCLPTGEGALNLSFPPIEWLQPATKRPVRGAVPHARLLAGKPVVVQWKDARTFTHPGTLSPDQYDEDTSSVAYSLSWKVTLVPVKS